MEHRRNLNGKDETMCGLEWGHHIRDGNDSSWWLWNTHDHFLLAYTHRNQALCPACLAISTFVEAGKESM